MKYYSNPKAKVIIDDKKQKLIVYANGKSYKGKLKELKTLSETAEDSLVISGGEQLSEIEAQSIILNAKLSFLENKIKLSPKEWEEYKAL